LSQYQAFEPHLINFVKQADCADVAHDFAHVQRVVAVAKKLALVEHANLDIVVPAAWLHDCVAVAKDSPLRSKASKLAAEKGRQFLIEIGYPAHLLSDIEHAIEAHSYSANIETRTLEAKIVQDADRLDALGAIGVARCMLVGGSIGRTLYCGDDMLCDQRTPDDKQYTIDHFFTKLLYIGDTMKTPAAHREARRRTDYMRSYISQLKHDVLADEIGTHGQGKVNQPASPQTTA
jgi:uncharacterized protein